ncbi:M4 family metallopeptidase [Bacillus sp. FDAARGOS_1420]|uniref:M4 family metallopeptidase n=2 Tax=unclassified Bacillus (in: firmicutes) TaxID=185979 RepID=UPI001C5ACC00|nr:M4 family metallopeptidase [Bacillus sp. FDAARGOS_1420]MBW3496876.1 M4 family metallopeptidase [Bacillus sp. FDAARGOS_1420]
MKKTQLGIGLSLGLVFTSLSSISVLAEQNVLSIEKFNEKVDSPEFISGQLTSPNTNQDEKIIFSYLNANKDKYKLGDTSAEKSFIVTSKQKDPLGSTIIRLQQVYNGIPVWGSTQVAHIKNNGILTVFSGTVQPNLHQQQSIQTVPSISQNQAISIAEKDLGFIPKYEKKPTADHVIYTNNNHAANTYVVKLNFLSPQPGNYFYFIDTKTGDIVHKFNTIDNIHSEQQVGRGPEIEKDVKQVGTGIGVLGDTKSLHTVLTGSNYYLKDMTRGKGIFTYDAKDADNIPGTLWYNSTGSFINPYDAPAVDAHYYAGKTYDYYKSNFNRNSYDNIGSSITSSVHYGTNYNNAFWNGQQMVYGDGDGQMFLPLSGAIDVVGHELTHAVTEFSSSLLYQGESGALNESISDIFGILIRFYDNRNPNYEIGEGIYKPGTPGSALRSMDHPEKLGYPDHYSKRYIGPSDRGGVHKNSSIINKAAYLLAEGGLHYGITVPGIGRDKMGAIYYRANTSYFTQSTTFSQARAALEQAAADLYGTDSEAVDAVSKSFDAVGIH